MKNVFIPLTITEDSAKEEGKEIYGSRKVYVNMSRVQEIYSRMEGGSELVMNIPDYVIHVTEPPAAVLALLEAVNTEDPELAQRLLKDLPLV